MIAMAFLLVGMLCDCFKSRRRLGVFPQQYARGLTDEYHCPLPGNRTRML
jgi:hypothetical protein